MAPTAIATERFGGAEEAAVLVWTRAQGRWWRNCLAVCFAGLIAVIPYVGPASPHTVVSVAPAFASFSVSDDLGSERDPASGIRAIQLLAFGVVTRSHVLDGTFGLPPAKSPGIRASADRELRLVSSAARHRVDGAGQVFQRSSVGTARIATGPPV